MPYNALEWHVSVQVNVTRAGFAESTLLYLIFDSFGPASSGIGHLRHLALLQIT